MFLGAEIASFVVVAEQIGFLWALAILLVVSALGPFVVRRVGVGVLAQTQARLARGEIPTRELLDGLVVLIGGLMICIPGYISDALGLMLMISPVRRGVIRVAGRGLGRKLQTVRIVRSWRPMSPPPNATFDSSSPALELPRPALDPGDASPTSA